MVVLLLSLQVGLFVFCSFTLSSKTHRGKWLLYQQLPPVFPASLSFSCQSWLHIAPLRALNKMSTKTTKPANSSQLYPMRDSKVWVLVTRRIKITIPWWYLRYPPKKRQFTTDLVLLLVKTKSWLRYRQARGLTNDDLIAEVLLRAVERGRQVIAPEPGGLLWSLSLNTVTSSAIPLPRQCFLSCSLFVVDKTHDTPPPPPPKKKKKIHYPSCVCFVVKKIM